MIIYEIYKCFYSTPNWESKLLNNEFHYHCLMRLNELFNENKEKNIIDELIKKYSFPDKFSFLNPLFIKGYKQTYNSNHIGIYGFDSISEFGGSTKEWIQNGFYFLRLLEIENNKVKFPEINQSIKDYMNSLEKIFPYLLCQHELELEEKINSFNIMEIGNNLQNILLCRKDDPSEYKRVTKENIEQFIKDEMRDNYWGGAGFSVDFKFKKTMNILEQINKSQTIFNKTLSEQDVSKVKYAIKADLYKIKNEIPDDIKKSIEQQFSSIKINYDKEENSQSIQKTICEVFNKEEIIKNVLKYSAVESLENEPPHLER